MPTTMKTLVHVYGGRDSFHAGIYKDLLRSNVYTHWPPGSPYVLKTYFPVKHTGGTSSVRIGVANAAWECQTSRACVDDPSLNLRKAWHSFSRVPLTCIMSARAIVCPRFVSPPRTVTPKALILNVHVLKRSFLQMELQSRMRYPLAC